MTLLLSSLIYAFTRGWEQKYNSCYTIFHCEIVCHANHCGGSQNNADRNLWERELEKLKCLHMTVCVWCCVVLYNWKQVLWKMVMRILTNRNKGKKWWHLQWSGKENNFTGMKQKRKSFNWNITWTVPVSMIYSPTFETTMISIYQCGSVMIVSRPFPLSTHYYSIVVYFQFNMAMCVKKGDRWLLFKPAGFVVSNL